MSSKILGNSYLSPMLHEPWTNWLRSFFFISHLIQKLSHSLHGDELSPTAENFEIHLDRRNFYIADLRR